MDHMRPDQRLGRPQEPGYDASLRGDDPSARKRPALVLIAAALLLLVVAGASVAVYTFALDTPASTAGLGTSAPAAQAPVAGQAVTTAVEPPPVPLNRVFTFRDIFDPLIEPAAQGDGSVPTIPAPTGEEADGSRITLQDVVSVDGEPAAVLMLAGETYTLAVGESIPDTPWRVLRIVGQLVELQYGDSQVTLGIGEGHTPSVK